MNCATHKDNVCDCDAKAAKHRQEQIEEGGTMKLRRKTHDHKRQKETR